TSLPIHDRGAPLRSLVHRWLSELGVRVVHAGAVATAAGAALLVGGGGTGKSTTSLACRESGLDFLGDDYVAIELEPMQVHSLYCSAKISWKHPAPVASGLTAVNRDRSDEKALFFLPDRAIAIAPIRAIIAPRVVVGSASRLNPISAGQALAAFAPSSVLQLPGDPGPTLADLRTLCNQVPAFELLLGSDIEVVGELVEQALMS
ncbi:MAG TPA: hypothetical protein VN866_01355, partial [Mycobacterium sp.]|nr:hypothetical protein [Mycobacterium sp.]